MDDFAAPVKGIVKALDHGIKLAKRVSRSASSAPAEQALQISESAHSLQTVLDESSRIVSDAYRHTLAQCGDPFVRALVEDQSLQPKLKELRIDLIDQINECDFDEDEPDTFNPTAFRILQEQAENCCNECIDIFNQLGDRILQTTLRDFRLDERPKDDRAQLSTMREFYRETASNLSPPASLSPQHDRPVLTLENPPAVPVKPRSTWSMDGTPQHGIGAPAASRVPSNFVPVPQAPYRGETILVMSPTSKNSNEEINIQRRQLGPPYPVSPIDESQGRLISEDSPLSEQPPLLIGKEIVSSRLNQNEQFLERRRQSRLLFQSELRNSIFSIEENRASQSFSDVSVLSSPKLGYLTILGTSSEEQPVTRKGSSSRSAERMIVANDRSGPWNERLVPLNDRPSLQDKREVSETYSVGISEVYSDGVLPLNGQATSPIDERISRTGASGYDTFMTRQRSQGQASQNTRSSRTSSILQDVRLQDRPNTERKDSHASLASQESIFGLRKAVPLSPRLTEQTLSENDDWGHLATNLQIAGFGEGVEHGIEVVDQIDRDNGLILANEDQIDVQPTPSASMRSVDYPIRNDSSFSKFGGFCDGAKALIRGDTGFKIMKRPSGHYSATVSARCVKCSYEVGWNDVEKDRLLDPRGIYGNNGIRFRQKFISKSHLRTNSVDEPLYACIFCIEERRTVEEHDATVFFSVTKLFQHLAKHSRPLPNIGGMSILYGFQPPDVLDFDIHFTTPEPTFQQFSMMEITSKAVSRPSAHAIITHHPKNNRSGFRDPDGNTTLHFAASARIVGITFPERFHGQWCIGYHDGDRGSFPTSTVMIEMPAREDIPFNAQSNLVALAKWDFKPKDAREGGWLRFSKGDSISAVGYKFQDQWCWSGQTGTGSKAKFGLFPAAFVEGLREDHGSGIVGSAKLGTSPGSVKIGGGLGLGSLGSLIGRHKNSKAHERNASVRSSGSGGNGGLGGIVAIPTGLEVVNSPLQSTGSWRS